MLELQRCFYNKQSRDKRRAKPLQLFLRNNKLWEFSFATIPPIKEIPACLPFLMTQQECELTPDCVYRSFISIRRSCMHRGETQETFWLFPWRTFTRTATPVTICFHRDCFSGLVLKEEKILNIWNFMQIKWMKISGTLCNWRFYSHLKYYWGAGHFKCHLINVTGHEMIKERGMKKMSFFSTFLWKSRIFVEYLIWKVTEEFAEPKMNSKTFTGDGETKSHADFIKWVAHVRNWSNLIVL